ncbi:MAG: GNAT family N-acetyltransferase [Acidimicrobiales bacterium]
MDLRWELPLSADGIETQLGDGTPVRIRPIRAVDGPELDAAFARMSPRSRYLRFFTLRDELGATMLDAFTNIDHRNHKAWVVVDPAARSDTGSDEGLGIAVARLICLPDTPGVAEATLAVTDDYQRRGAGRLLLDLLVSTAVIAGVEKVRFETLWENRGMRRLLNDLGAESNSALSDGGVLVYDVPIDEDGDATVGAVYDILRWIAQSS